MVLQANAGAAFGACEHAYPHISPQSVGASFFDFFLGLEPGNQGGLV
jgi:hypothetical protein